MARHRGQLQGSARVLVVAEDPLGTFIAHALDHGVYTVETVNSVASAAERAPLLRPHLLVIDVDLRPGDASTLIGTKLQARRIPTIVLTTRAGDLTTKLAAFEKGADDFITVPISPEELVARAFAVMRRTYGEDVPFAANINIGELEIDLLDHSVRSGGTRVELTTIEEALLYLLASNRGRTMTREAIADALWGSDFIAESNLIDRHVHNLRAKLSDDWQRPRFIRTVPGRGYEFLATQ